MWLLLKIALFTLVVPGSVIVWIPYFYLSRRAAFDLGPFKYLGLLPILVGAATYFRCAWEFGARGRGTPAPIDAPKTLVVTGLYRWVRNPMYVGVLMVLFGEAWFFGWRSLVGYALLFALTFHLFVVLVEEPLLRQKFGPAYDDYRRAVPRWLPRLRRSKDAPGQQHL